jgi:checkpoint serine/threonine-protein kinase
MADDLKNQRHRYQQRIAAIELEEDPLAVYVDFIHWTRANFDDNDPNSGLSQLLDEATRKFKNDELYKTDLRYLKLWTLYANRLSQRSAIGIYSQLWKKGFGVSYSLLYEEYALVLEAVGR